MNGNPLAGEINDTAWCNQIEKIMGLGYYNHGVVSINNPKQDFVCAAHGATMHHSKWHPMHPIFFVLAAASEIHPKVRNHWGALGMWWYFCIASSSAFCIFPNRFANVESFFWRDA
jgi:hypothetical protein